MDNYKQAVPATEVTSTSTLQKLKDRARSVDRYLSQQRLNLQKTPRGTSVARSDGSVQPTPELKTRKSRAVLIPVTNGCVRQPSQRWRSPSINGRLQQNLQNLASYLFERKNDAKKRALAERLLWTALRRNEIELLRDILDQLRDSALDINMKNEFGWNLVDEAIMLGYAEIAGELFKRGGRETAELRTKTQRQDALKRALRGLEAVQAASRIGENTSTRSLAADVAAGPTFAVVQQMMQHVDRIRPPKNHLEEVTVQAWSESSVAVHYHGRTVEAGVISRFKVEWCRDRHFESAIDYEIFQDIVQPDQLVVEGLASGIPYFIRLSVANLAGFGMPVTAQPAPLVITCTAHDTIITSSTTRTGYMNRVATSSWRDVDPASDKHSVENALSELVRILQNVENMEHVVRNATNRHSTSIRTVQRRPSLKDSIKSIIKPNLAKTCCLEDGGLFLGCLIAMEDSILLTSDLTLPVCLTQSPFLGTLSAKQHLWLQKLCSVPSLAGSVKDLLHSSKDSTSDIRYSMIQAVVSLQSFLGLDDLGAPYYRVIQDTGSSLTLLLLIRRLSPSDSYKPPFGQKWLHVKEVELMSIGPCDGMLKLIASTGLHELLAYDNSVHTTIPAGLHLGFVQLQPSLDNVAVVVSKSHPGTLPAVRIRSNPHVDRNEWMGLLEHKPSHQFRNQILSSWVQLKNDMSLRSVEEAYLYGSILQLGPQTTMIVLYSDSQGLAARHSLDEELRRGALSIAVQTLESIHFHTYQKEYWRLYCQSSLTLDALSAYLNQHQREVFGSEDLNVKNMLNQVQNLQDRLERTWSKCRWLPDVIRTVTGRAARRLPLLPPSSLTSDAAPRTTMTLPRLPFKPVRLLGPTKALPKVVYDNVSVTVVIQPKNVSANTCNQGPVQTHPPEVSPSKENFNTNLSVTIDGITTAEDVVQQVLARSVGSLATKLMPSYSLGTLVDGQLVCLESDIVVRDFCAGRKDVQFSLTRRSHDGL